jgi:hypothetical protein
MSKLDTLLEIEGLDSSDEFIQNFALDSIVPGICMNSSCECTYDYEPDQDKGWCDACSTTSVTSGLILLGII